jgi:hypothetical protein
VPTSNGPSQRSACPYLAQFRPRGREHTYELCEATGEAPLVPSRTELEELCRGDHERCPHFMAARRREAA